MPARVVERGRKAQGKGPRPDKVAKVEVLKERFSRASSVVLFDYRGLGVSQMTDLRRRTREAGVDLSVVKNSLLERAVEGTPFEVVRGRLVGPISIATTQGDPAMPAKVLKGFLRGVSAGQITGGVLDGRFLEPQEVEAIAELPSREVLLGWTLGALQGPVAGLARLLSGVIGQLLNALQAIANERNKV